MIELFSNLNGIALVAYSIVIVVIAIIIFVIVMIVTGKKCKERGIIKNNEKQITLMLKD